MKQTYLLSLVLLLTTACELKEVSQQPPPGDAAMPVNDAANPPDAAEFPDAPIVPDPIDAAPDAFDDPVIPPGSALGSCDPSPWIASASDSHPANPPIYAIDGLLPSRWSTGAAQAPGQHFDIDLGGFVMVSNVTIQPVFEVDGHGDYPHGIDIFVSYDGVDFSRHLKKVIYGNADPGLVSIDFPAHAARHLRLQLNQGIGNWWSIHDMRIGCSVPDGPPDGGVDTGPLNPGPDGGPVTNRAAWAATGTPVSATEPVPNALDGMPTTRWSTGKTPQYSDEVFRLDLGAVMDVSGVELRSVMDDFPSAYMLEVSTDDVTYTLAARGLGHEVTTILFRRLPARYIRIKQIGAGWQHVWAINELDVLQ